MKSLKKVLFTTAITLGAVLFLVALFFTLSLYAQNRFPKGTTISGINVSFKTYDQAIAKVEKVSSSYLESLLTIKTEEKSVDLSPSDLGISILSEPSVKSLSNNKQDLISFFFPNKNLKSDLIVKIDQEVLQQVLNKELELDKIAPINANFYFEGQKLHSKEGEKGYALDMDNLLKSLNSSAQNLTPTTITLGFNYQDPPVTLEILEKYRKDVSDALFRKFTLVDPIYTGNWVETLVAHPDWVVFVPQPEKVLFKLNAEAFNKYVDEEISKWLDVPATNVTIKKNGAKADIEGFGQDGSTIKRGEFLAAVEEVVNNGGQEVLIPIDVIKPEISVDAELQSVGIKERIAVGHTSFYGSPANRVHNIKVATEHFNGTIIPAGETFSFNHNLGPVDSSTGYREELVIKPEGTIPEYGGGVCQVSTTLYRAVLLSGLPVVERNQHSYAVSYYSQVLGHGLDATIYIGGPDLKFTNDTSGAIAVQAYVKNDYELFFIFYGTDPQREVELEGPYLSNYRKPGETIYQETTTLPVGKTKQAEKAHTGFNALWYRHIKDLKTGETVKETISTNYKAIPAKVLIGVEAQ